MFTEVFVRGHVGYCEAFAPSWLSFRKEVVVIYLFQISLHALGPENVLWLALTLVAQEGINIWVVQFPFSNTLRPVKHCVFKIAFTCVPFLPAILTTTGYYFAWTQEVTQLLFIYKIEIATVIVSKCSWDDIMY
jgi:hypothetical protein